MISSTADRDFGSLESVLADATVADKLSSAVPTSYAAAAAFWRVPIEAGALTPRMTELVLLAMHATATVVNVHAVERHIERAQAAGASAEDILDVLLTIVGVANHALYTTVPILEEELADAGVPTPGTSGSDPRFEAAKAAFVSSRGFWNPDRDQLARLMPDYFAALHGVATDSWDHGTLSAKERELVCIGIDCTVTHVFESGLRRHMRNAIGQGATREEILHVLQLAALLGLEGYLIGARALFGDRPRGAGIDFGTE